MSTPATTAHKGETEMTIEKYLNEIAASEGLNINVSRNSYGYTFKRDDREIGRAYYPASWSRLPAKRLRAYVLSLRGFARLQRHIDSLPPFKIGH